MTDDGLEGLGEHREAIEERVPSGSYASAGEVLGAALRALGREEAALRDVTRERVEAALTDPRPPVPVRDVFERLETRHAGAVRG